MNRCLSLMVLLCSLALSAQARALPGLDGYRWQTTFQLLDGTLAAADLTVEGMDHATTYVSNTDSVDGALVINSVTPRPDGLTGRFAGTWQRNGDHGSFFFDVLYQNGQPVELRGYYDSPSTHGMQLPWNGKL